MSTTFSSSQVLKWSLLVWKEFTAVYQIHSWGAIRKMCSICLMMHFHAPRHRQAPMKFWVSRRPEICCNFWTAESFEVNSSTMKRTHICVSNSFVGGNSKNFFDVVVDTFWYTTATSRASGKEWGSGRLKVTLTFCSQRVLKQTLLQWKVCTSVYQLWSWGAIRKIVPIHLSRPFWWLRGLKTHIPVRALKMIVTFHFGEISYWCLLCRKARIFVYQNHSWGAIQKMLSEHFLIHFWYTSSTLLAEKKVSPGDLKVSQTFLCRRVLTSSLLRWIATTFDYHKCSWGAIQKITSVVKK